MIYKKLFELQSEGHSLKKNCKVQFKSVKYNYLTLDKLLDFYMPILTDKNILVFHQTINNKVVTTLHDMDDESEVKSEFDLIGSDPQRLGSCITYGKRYNLGELLNIIIDEDDDGQRASKSTCKICKKDCRQGKIYCSQECFDLDNKK